jgi:homopolymeric O-antigen transport system ATP-binding protein
MDTAIATNNLGKRYRLGTDVERYQTLRDAIRRAVHRRTARGGEIWALRDLTLRVRQGEAVGIIGPNGAGKTTLLRILAGITEPTSGEARTRGRVGALLDVGTGLHPELTGEENIYLGGAILGLRRAELRRRFDDIVSFAGVEEFLATPVKRYSAGMRLRLAFAVAAHIEPPIVVVDEILAVGDSAFQEKCLGKMAEIGTRERTVLFVSHDLGAVTRLCSRAIWLERGRLRQDGEAREVVSAYLEANRGTPLTAHFSHDDSDVVGLTAAAIRDTSGRILHAVRRGDPVLVELQFVARRSFPGLDVAFAIVDEDGTRVVDDAWSDRRGSGAHAGEPGKYMVQAVFPGVLRPGQYAVQVWIGNDFETLVERHVLTVDVAPRAEDTRVSIDRRRVVQPPVDWNVEREPLDGRGVDA